ncbi:uncharacterized protein LOC104873614 [Fukomys damarensis]|uniref:uncharacterized protein LOC104873614 n=1 Tax=Fukomys damarensis TaxID=885580 RepID=UPI00053FB236|nr:uncharacterized protein LOC104873614 [Fukomys damarensis]
MCGPSCPVADHGVRGRATEIAPTHPPQQPSRAWGGSVFPGQPPVIRSFTPAQHLQASRSPGAPSLAVTPAAGPGRDKAHTPVLRAAQGAGSLPLSPPRADGPEVRCDRSTPGQAQDLPAEEAPARSQLCLGQRRAAEGSGRSSGLGGSGAAAQTLTAVFSSGQRKLHRVAPGTKLCCPFGAGGMNCTGRVSLAAGSSDPSRDPCRTAGTESRASPTCLPADPGIASHQSACTEGDDPSMEAPGGLMFFCPQTSRFLKCCLNLL